MLCFPHIHTLSITSCLSVSVSDIGSKEERQIVKYFYQIGFIEQTKVIRFAECYQEFNQVSIFLSGEIKPDRYINYNKYIHLKRIIIRRLTLFPELIV